MNYIYLFLLDKYIASNVLLRDMHMRCNCILHNQKNNALFVDFICANAWFYAPC